MLNYSRGAEELAAYYARGEHNIEGALKKIGGCLDSHGDEPAVTRKSFIHRLMAAECDVKVFPHFPFFYEIDVGRGRCDWGLGSPLSCALKNRSEGEWLSPYREELKGYEEAGLLHGQNPVGYDHHCPGYDAVLGEGLLGFIARAKARLASPDKGLHPISAALLRQARLSGLPRAAGALAGETTHH